MVLRPPANRVHPVTVIDEHQIPVKPTQRRPHRPDMVAIIPDDPEADRAGAVLSVPLQQGVDMRDSAPAAMPATGASGPRPTLHALSAAHSSPHMAAIHLHAVQEHVSAARLLV